MFASKLFRKAAIAGLAAALFCAPAQSFAKETVKVGFIGPLTGGLSSLGVGGRNSAELAVQEANEDPNTKFLYEMTAYDDECKPNVGIQVATKAASDRKMVGPLRITVPPWLLALWASTTALRCRPLYGAPCSRISPTAMTTRKSSVRPAP